MDSDDPGGVYLCQVNAQVSCGACCGLYNVADVSRDELTRVLEQRSKTFATLPRTVAAIDGFARETRAMEYREHPFPDFHHCPFIGLIGRRHSRVGCMLHPLAEGNQGLDFRGLSDYGGLACRTYFCPSTHRLPARHKQVLRLVLDDWYLYGLVVTETELIGALFQWIETRLGHPMNASQVAALPEAKTRLGELLALKLHWPYRPAHMDTPCHYFFTDPPHVRPAIDYRGLGIAPSPKDAMLRELVSAFSTTAEWKTAEQLLECRLDAAVRALAQK